MYTLKSVKKFIILCGIAIFVFNQNIFAEGPDEIEEQKIAIVGDSYAGHFSLNEGTDKYEYYIFPVGKIDNAINEQIFQTAINADNRYILFATGVNDQALNTDIEKFELELRKYATEMSEKNKYLFLHTYMNYDNHKNGIGKFHPVEYDRVYKRLAEEYENVIYIDMSGFETNRYDFGDGMHFNKFFYDTLNAKLLFFIRQIDRSSFNVAGTEIKSEQKKHIATAGDIAADEFFGYENKKDYIITNFANPGKTISENYDEIIKAIEYDAQCIFIALGTDDYKAQTDMHVFMDEIRKCLNEACLNYKNVFLYTSLDYAKDEHLITSMVEYDLAMAKVANEYPNTCYINLGNYTKEIPQIYDLLYDTVNIMIERIY